MDDADIRRYVAELEANVAKEGGQLLISDWDEQGTYCQFVANRTGYLRAAIEMLRAAVEPLDPGQFETSVDLNYLVGKHGALIKRLIRRENVETIPEPLKKRRSWKQIAASVGCLGAFVCLAVCAVIGVVQIFIWITGN
jgi:hypothetical protein